MSSPPPAPARPSASVVVVRDGADALEVLMLRRNQDVAFHGGAWVFPGGRVDETDAGDTATSELDRARRAAVRETLEEAGIGLGVDDMLPFAHWTTPIELPKRFATWFFVAPLKAPVEVRIDHSEIVDHRWLTPASALELRARGELDLPAPTFVTLLGFRDLAGVTALAAQLRGTPVQYFEPRLVPMKDGRCTLYREDAGYETRDFDAPGPRHRLIMQAHDWRYVREF